MPSTDASLKLTKFCFCLALDNLNVLDDLGNPFKKKVCKIPHLAFPPSPLLRAKM